jgi:hypothetical protein
MEKIINKILIIFIDTTIYTEVKTNNIDGTCFTHIFDDIKKDNITFKDLCDYQNNKVMEILDKYKNNIEKLIIIAHHPIISIKKKNNNNNIDKINGLINLYQLIYKKLNNILLYHLCADTHLFQEGTIILNDEIEIQQYICGTGGADKDNCSTDLKEYKSESIKYSIHNCLSKNGFLHVIIDNNNINFNFISNDDTQIRFYNKYVKYNKKYINIK